MGTVIGGTHHARGVPQSDLSQALVVPRLTKDEMDWVAEVNSNVLVKLYYVEQWDALLHPPKNKGHEALTYLTHIINCYDAFSDLAIFMHAHRYAHHNNKALNLDAVQIVNRLERENVNRLGYMNLHCSHDVGCPMWLKLHENQAPLEKQEQEILAKCWRELYPQTKLPRNMGQPCCGQFALSKSQVLSIPLERLIYLRDWLLRTSLTDYFSGRIWEYLWHFVFLQQDVVCIPVEDCLCQGFHVCSSTGFIDEAGGA